MDSLRIDSHKLMYHIPRVNDWIQGKDVYPIYMEISPSGACNHRCTYCGLDFMEYQARRLDTSLLKERLTELGQLGLKSVMFAGEGEPFLHKDMADITLHAKKSAIDVAFTTNGTLLKKEIADQILSSTSWIKVSINGATEETYAKIHQCPEADFKKVIDHLTYAAELRDKENLSCALGMQLLLLPENHHEAIALAQLARDIGMDYLVIKPYSQHPQSKTKKYQDIKYDEFLYLKEELDRIVTDKFKVIFRLGAMKKWDGASRNYQCCQALPFWSYIDAGGKVWGCSVYLNDERFFYGNIYENTFQEIWESQRRKESLKWVLEKLDASQCRVNCRMDEVNRYLWELRNPSNHVNFI